jgi:hypothetical protein
MRKFLPLLLLVLLAACQFNVPEVIPTVAMLPTLTASPIPSQTPITPTVPPTLTPPPTDTPPPTPTFTPEPPTLTPTPPPTETPLPPTLTDTPAGTPTFTLTLTPEFSYTPSLTITNTMAPTLTPSLTPSPEVTGIMAISLLAENVTILPPEIRYNPQTLTAVHYAAETLIAIGTVAPIIPVESTNDPNVLATFPPPAQVSPCTGGVPWQLGLGLASEALLAQLVGCPQGGVTSTTTAFQKFERGVMIYEQSTSSIYALTLSDMRYRRFPDTWVEGVDPDSGGEAPPPGLIEPRRGFGKVWRSNPDVRAALGWATTEEQGAATSYQRFERGWAFYLPQNNYTIVMSYDPINENGSWEAFEVNF